MFFITTESNPLPSEWNIWFGVILLEGFPNIAPCACANSHDSKWRIILNGRRNPQNGFWRISWRLNTRRKRRMNQLEIINFMKSKYSRSIKKLKLTIKVILKKLMNDVRMSDISPKEEIASVKQRPLSEQLAPSLITLIITQKRWFLTSNQQHCIWEIQCRGHIGIGENRLQ